MKNWTYTDDIHNSVTIDHIKFRINTSYDNIIRLLKHMGEERDDKLETFFRIIFYPQDHDKIQALTKDWKPDEYYSFNNFIMDAYVMIDTSQGGKKTNDLYKDSELIFASFYYDYGISLIEKKGKMTWKEFIILLSNLSPQSPLGRAIKIMETPDNELSPEGKAEKRNRKRMLNSDIDINNQLDSLAKFLKTTAKKR